MKPLKEYIDEEMINCPLTIMQEDKLLIAIDRYIATELEAKNLQQPDVMKSICQNCNGSGKIMNICGLVECSRCKGVGQTVL